MVIVGVKRMRIVVGTKEIHTATRAGAKKPVLVQLEISTCSARQSRLGSWPNLFSMPS